LRIQKTISLISEAILVFLETVLFPEDKDCFSGSILFKN